MAEGTRIRGLDERLGIHDVRLTEVTESLNKTREEVSQNFGEINHKMDEFERRMDTMESNFEELKLLIMGLQPSKGADEITATQNTDIIPEVTNSIVSLNSNTSSCLTHTPGIYTSPYTLSVQTTLSTGQFYYAIEDANSFGDLRPVNMDVCEIDDKLEVVIKREVKPDVEEVNKLEARVECDVVVESEMKDDLRLEEEDRSVGEGVDDITEIVSEIETEITSEADKKNGIVTAPTRSFDGPSKLGLDCIDSKEATKDFDAFVQSDIKLWPFKITPGPGEKLITIVAYQVEDISKSSGTYSPDHTNEKNVLIFDPGGGTFAVSFHTIEEGIDFYSIITRFRNEELNMNLFRKSIKEVCKSHCECNIGPSNHDCLGKEKIESDLGDSGSMDMELEPYQVVEKRGRVSKKNKMDSQEAMLKIILDRCSKRGDVIGAIQLFDLAQRDAIKLTQYHYAVLLYLCSSATTGVVQPAKSGKVSRSVNTMDTPNISSEDNFYEGIGKGSLGSGLSGNEKSNGSTDLRPRTLEEMIHLIKNDVSFSNVKYVSGGQIDCEIQVCEDVKNYALERGFEIYKEMLLEKVPVNEAMLTSVARMAMSMGNGGMAFDVVKQMKALGINPKLKSYGPALSVFTNTGDIENAFLVEKHMLVHGVYPEESELEALLRASIEAENADKVYYLLHKLRTIVRKVSPSTACLIENWFCSNVGTILAWQYKVPTNSFEPAASLITLLLLSHSLSVLT